MEDKLNLIKRYEKGENVSVIAHALGLPRSTVSTIIHDRERILAYATEKAPPAKTAVMNVKRGQIFDEMERLLSLWIERQTHERIPTSQLLIQEKAKSLFQDLLKKYPEDKDTTFVASSGWFARFKRRFSLHNVKIQGEAAAADTVASKEFPATLKKIIEDEGFLPEQIFNVDETEWFINHFIPAVKSYCREKKIQFKLLLILDNAPGHPTNLSDFDPNVKVVYLPPKTTSLIQPMDQGVIALFKHYYLRRTLRQAVDATSEEEGINMRQFWKNYNIYQAVLNINAAWLEVTQSAINGVWKRLCPNLVNDFMGFDAPVRAVSKNLVSLSADLEMDLEEEDFDGLIEADKQLLTNEDLMALKEERHEEDELPEPESRKFTAAEMQKGFYHLSKCLATFEAQDPNAERFAKMMNGTSNLFLPYRTILTEKKKCIIQGTLDQFLLNVEKCKASTSFDESPKKPRT
uniref:tigger transposable element-derived protein 1-like n=1 Tax=Myxine glutinosa TaxID=7769 RepID=UPI00358FBA1D